MRLPAALLVLVLFVSLPALAAPALAVSSSDDVFPRVSRFQERQAIPARQVRALCADCEELPPIDTGLTPGGMPTYGCNNLYVCSRTRGCYFAVYARCFIEDSAAVPYGQWHPCHAC